MQSTFAKAATELLLKLKTFGLQKNSKSFNFFIALRITNYTFANFNRARYLVFYV